MKTWLLKLRDSDKASLFLWMSHWVVILRFPIQVIPRLYKEFKIIDSQFVFDDS